MIRGVIIVECRLYYQIFTIKVSISIFLNLILQFFWLLFILSCFQHILDHQEQTALNLCENITEANWQEAAGLLQNAMAKPVSWHLILKPYSIDLFSPCHIAILTLIHPL